MEVDALTPHHTDYSGWDDPTPNSTFLQAHVYHTCYMAIYIYIQVSLRYLCIQDLQISEYSGSKPGGKGIPGPSEGDRRCSLVTHAGFSEARRGHVQLPTSECSFGTKKTHTSTSSFPQEIESDVFMPHKAPRDPGKHCGSHEA